MRASVAGSPLPTKSRPRGGEARGARRVVSDSRRDATRGGARGEGNTAGCPLARGDLLSLCPVGDRLIHGDWLDWDFTAKDVWFQVQWTHLDAGVYVSGRL